MRDQAVDLMELSLFPLDAVLFPGQVLPLHIFEDRYLQMIRQCLAEDSSFGVVLIRKGPEMRGKTEPHSVGTTARIVESSHLGDGTMNIVTVGVERFRIHQLFYDRPYLRGNVEMLPMPEVDDQAAVAQLSEQVRARVERYIKLIAEAAGLKIRVGGIPEQAKQVGYLAAVAMQIDHDEKQALLESASLSDILAAEVALLNRENALLTWMVGSKEWPEAAQFGPSGTLLPN